jgi:hypothetical protein
MILSASGRRIRKHKGAMFQNTNRTTLKRKLGDKKAETRNARLDNQKPVIRHDSTVIKLRSDSENDLK